MLTVSKAELERLRLRKVLAHKRTDELAQDLVSKLLTLGFTQADAVLNSTCAHHRATVTGGVRGRSSHARSAVAASRFNANRPVARVCRGASLLAGELAAAHCVSAVPTAAQSEEEPNCKGPGPSSREDRQRTGKATFMHQTDLDLRAIALCIARCQARVHLAHASARLSFSCASARV